MISVKGMFQIMILRMKVFTENLAVFE